MKLFVGNVLIFIPFLLTIDELRLQVGKGDFFSFCKEILCSRMNMYGLLSSCIEKSKYGVKLIKY